ncbi:MAG TPA: class I SAM-dependent rRNA methyltransferase [Acidobacteriota bacterium]|nr:class I SAM-dependent rRNA methyltransferase [Acidobacteriota bacterium]
MAKPTDDNKAPAKTPPQPKTPAQPEAVLTRRGAQRVRGLHPWIYRSDVQSVRAAGGDLVRVKGPRGREVGYALYSDASQIALRRFAGRGPRPGREVWRDRLEAAIAYRHSLQIDADAYRLVHAEADGLPALIVDRYADCLVVQLLTQGVDRGSDEIVELLVELLEPTGILARNDRRVRELEGLERRIDVLYGEVPSRVRIRDGAAHLEVDLRSGQKTGLFLDQRENRAAARDYAHGRLLDCFSYHGAFALQLAARCDEVIALDISEDAVAAIQRNAAINEVALEARCVNAFDHLRELSDRGETFDTIVLDPPAFAKNKAALKGALGGYKEINLRALKLLRPGGHLVTSSCSYHVGDTAFLGVIEAAAADVGAELVLVERRGQSRDHPVRIGMPESRYLKCMILRKRA